MRLRTCLTVVLFAGAAHSASAAGSAASLGALGSACATHIKTAAGAHNIATLISGVLFGVRTITRANANGVWANPNPNENSGRFFCDSDSTITKSVASGTANGTAHAHAANAIGWLGWGNSHEVSAIPVTSGKKSAFASAFARNSTTYKAKISNFDSTDDVSWSQPFEAQVDLGVATNLTSVGPDPLTPPTLTSVVATPMRFERGRDADGSFHFEFGYSNIRTSLFGQGGPDVPVFAFDVSLDQYTGFSISGSALAIPGLVTMDPDVENDGIDWIEIQGSVPLTFEVGGLAPSGDSDIDVFWDTYSQATGDLTIAVVPAPGAAALGALGALALAARGRRQHRLSPIA